MVTIEARSLQVLQQNAEKLVSMQSCQIKYTRIYKNRFFKILEFFGNNILLLSSFLWAPRLHPMSWAPDTKQAVNPPYVNLGSKHMMASEQHCAKKENGEVSSLWQKKNMQSCDPCERYLAFLHRNFLPVFISNNFQQCLRGDADNKGGNTSLWCLEEAYNSYKNKV